MENLKQPKREPTYFSFCRDFGNSFIISLDKYPFNSEDLFNFGIDAFERDNKNWFEQDYSQSGMELGYLAGTIVNLATLRIIPKALHYFKKQEKIPLS